MAAKQPNILIMWGDDIGMWNISWYSRGLMGYRTPNIDRIANEGIAFTDYYGQQSCTAGRAAFITGQNPLRTGMTKVGMPGSTLACKQKIQPSRSCSNLSATLQASSERTTLATGMNICRQCADSMSSTASSIT